MDIETVRQRRYEYNICFQVTTVNECKIGGQTNGNVNIGNIDD
jgi:hypothetical protein